MSLPKTFCISADTHSAGIFAVIFTKRLMWSTTPFLSRGLTIFPLPNSFDLTVPDPLHFRHIAPSKMALIQAVVRQRSPPSLLCISLNLLSFPLVHFAMNQKRFRRYATSRMPSRSPASPLLLHISHLSRVPAMATAHRARHAQHMQVEAQAPNVFFSFPSAAVLSEVRLCIDLVGVSQSRQPHTVTVSTERRGAHEKVRHDELHVWRWGDMKRRFLRCVSRRALFIFSFAFLCLLACDAIRCRCLAL
jgi:hypothetical protein